MDLILEDIQRALRAGASYAALAAAVTLPEICGRCEQQDMYSRKGKNSGDKVFNRFVDKYLHNWDIGLTGADLYSLRNGLSHRGQLTERRNTHRYVFFPPNTGSVVHNNLSFQGGELVRVQIDLQKFCDDISEAVKKWQVDQAENELVQKNLEDVLQAREGDFGTGIFIQGVHYLA